MSALFASILLAKVTLLLLGALGLDHVLRRKAALACAAMWNAAILALAALLLLCPTMPAVEIPVALVAASGPAPHRHSFEPAPAAAPADPAPLLPDVAEKNVTIQKEPTTAQPLAWRTATYAWPLLGGIYLAGVAVLALRLVVSLLAVRRLMGQATDVQDAAWRQALGDCLAQIGSRARIRLKQSPEISVPIACGWREPTIVIPTDLVDRLSTSTRQGVLVHELVHLLRRDYSWQLLLRFLQVVLWFHPLLWWAERRIHFIRERVCDDYSIFFLGGSEMYGDTLLDVAARCPNRPSLSLGLAMLQPSRLEQRLAALDESPGCRTWRVTARFKCALTVFALLLAIAVSPLATKPALRAEEPKGKSSKPAPAKPAPQPEIHLITVSGRALDGDGKPVEGATIYLISSGAVQQTLGEVKSDRNGHYEFKDAKLPVPKKPDTTFLETGYFVVFGKAPDRAFGWRGMKMLCTDRAFVGPDGKLVSTQRESGYLPGEKIELDLTFAAAHPITGRVVDEQGRPISDVRIDLCNCDFLDTAGKESHRNYREFWGIGQASELMPEQFSAVSDAEGKFELPHVPPEMVLWLQVEHTDYAHTSLYTATSDSPPAEHDDGHPVVKLPLEIKLHSVRTIPVEVTFVDTGKPAAGVSVSAYEMRASGNFAGGKSDDKGRVVLKLPPGRYQFQGDPPQDSDYIRTIQEFVIEKTPAQQPATLKLNSGCVIVFKAVDADTGRGVPGVSFWYEMDSPKGRRAGVQANTTHISHPTSNEKGELRAVVVSGRRHYGIGLSPLPGDYKPVDSADQSPGRKLTCPAGQTVTVEFQVRKPRK